MVVVGGLTRFAGPKAPLAPDETVIPAARPPPLIGVAIQSGLCEERESVRDMTVSSMGRRCRFQSSWIGCRPGPASRGSLCK